MDSFLSTYFLFEVIKLEMYKTQRILSASAKKQAFKAKSTPAVGGERCAQGVGGEARGEKAIGETQA
jgi:hypothetical protein